MRTWAHRFATCESGLRSWGIHPGDIVGAALPSRPEMAVAIATLPSSCTFAPLDPSLPSDAYAMLLARITAQGGSRAARRRACHPCGRASSRHRRDRRHARTGRRRRLVHARLRSRRIDACGMQIGRSAFGIRPDELGDDWTTQARADRSSRGRSVMRVRCATGSISRRTM
jgi:hypothetical protein